MTKPSDNQIVKHPQGRKSPDAKAPSQQKQQGQKGSAARPGERPIADVDRKVRGGDA